MTASSNNVIGNITDFNNDGTLGFVVWHSVADVRITESEVAALANKHGMSTHPKLGSVSDAFRRATAASQQRSEDGKTRYLMRPVKDRSGEIVREIVVERVDSKGKRLAHIGAKMLEFVHVDKSHKPALNSRHTDEFFHLTPEEQGTVDRLCTEAFDRYHEFTRSLTGKELTRFAMKCMSAMSYINLRPNGGVYFVPRTRAAALEALTNFFAELASYRASSAPMIFSSAPVPNCPVQKAQVAQGVDMTINSDIDQMIAKLASLRDEIGSVRQSTLDKKVAEIRALREKATAYAAILERENDTLDARLDILDQTIEGLFDRYAEEQTKKSA